MASNHLEDLVAEWLQFNGYFVRRNVRVGRRARGGYDCELDVVALHPSERKLVQIETSLDADSWAERETRYARKFLAGRTYIPTLFHDLNVPAEIDQRALLVFASTSSRTSVGDGSIWLIRDFMVEIREKLRMLPVAKAAVPEQFPLLRSLQFAANYWG